MRNLSYKFLTIERRFLLIITELPPGNFRNTVWFFKFVYNYVSNFLPKEIK